MLELCQSSLLRAVVEDAALCISRPTLSSNVVMRSSLNSIVKTVLAFKQVDEMVIWSTERLTSISSADPAPAGLRGCDPLVLLYPDGSGHVMSQYCQRLYEMTQAPLLDLLVTKAGKLLLNSEKVDNSAPFHGWPCRTEGLAESPCRERCCFVELLSVHLRGWPCSHVQPKTEEEEAGCTRLRVAARPRPTVFETLGFHGLWRAGPWSAGEISPWRRCSPIFCCLWDLSCLTLSRNTVLQR